MARKTVIQIQDGDALSGLQTVESRTTKLEDNLKKLMPSLGKQREEDLIDDQDKNSALLDLSTVS